MIKHDQLTNCSNHTNVKFTPSKSLLNLPFTTMPIPNLSKTPTEHFQNYNSQ
ncbi:hypothetical protein HanRHA438_Chr17g0828151 [Helianthus annuus]|nr:hypothetical protein HanRHA438_Chr17g0828151 [Helianthus annuus]